MERNIKITAVVAVVFLTVYLLAGCSSSPKTAGTDELDPAIREAADYLNANVPKGSKVAIISVKSDYQPLSEYIIDGLTENLVNDRLFTIVERGQLDAIRAELKFNLSGEVDDNSAQSIGRMVGAETIILGTTNPLGNNWRISVRALTVENAEVQGMFSKNIPSGGTIASLTSGQKTASAGSMSSSGGTATAGGTGGGGQATQAQTAQVLKNGTYTLLPRPRARREGGQWVNIYLARVEVDSRFVTFFFENAPTGGRGYGEGGYSSWNTGNVTVTNIDNPKVFIKSTGKTDGGNIYNATVIFPRFNFNRIMLEQKAGSSEGTSIEEIVLGEPDE